VSAGQAGEGECAHQQAEVAQRDVRAPAHKQQAHDDARQPAGHEQPAEARAQRNHQAGHDQCARTSKAVPRAPTSTTACATCSSAERRHQALSGVEQALSGAKLLHP
jgi:hypothetical protein